MNRRRNDLEIVIVTQRIASPDPKLGIDLLFTMSEIPHAHPAKDDAREVMFSRTMFLVGQAIYNNQPVFARWLRRGSLRYRKGLPSRSWRSQQRLVEPDGIEPTTSCLQSTRSPS
jgi:hypothetical protein